MTVMNNRPWLAIAPGRAEVYLVRQLRMTTKVLVKGLLGSLLCAGVAFATMNTCPNATATSSVSNGVTSNSVTIPGVAANDLQFLTPGCTAIDLTFTNFGASTFSGGVNGIGSLAGTYLAETPSGISGNPLANPDMLTFASVKGAASVAIDGNANDGNNNFVSDHPSNAIVDNIHYNVGLSGNNAAARVWGIVLTVARPVIQSGTSGSITIDVCSAGTTLITTSSACTTAGGTFSTHTLTLSTAASQSISIDFPTHLSTLDVTTIVTLTGSGGGNFAGFDTFSETPFESPEPATFALVGFALLGLGFLRYRRKTA